MKYSIGNSYGTKPVFWISVLLAGNWYTGSVYYTTRRAAIKGAKRAGGTEEVK